MMIKNLTNQNLPVFLSIGCNVHTIPFQKHTEAFTSKHESFLLTFSACSRLFHLHPLFHNSPSPRITIYTLMFVLEKAPPGGVLHTSGISCGPFTRKPIALFSPKVLLVLSTPHPPHPSHPSHFLAAVAMAFLFFFDYSLSLSESCFLVVR